MSRWLKIIWFKEGLWTKYHAAVGINAEKTLCRIRHSITPILPSEKRPELSPYVLETYRKNLNLPHCRKCLAVLRRKYGTEDITEVKVE